MTRQTTPNASAAIWRRPAVRRSLLVAILPVLAIAWWLASPLFIDRTVDEAFPAVAETEAEAAGEAAATPSASAPITGDASTAVETTVTEEPAQVAAGSFVDEDSVHQGSGTAGIYDVDGSIVLRLEDFDVTNGPDLRVDLVLTDGTMVDLGALKGNVGNQNYDIPADTDLDTVESVLIYCRAFSVRFSEAVLSR
jgi:hypothetical protein